MMMLFKKEKERRLFVVSKKEYSLSRARARFRNGQRTTTEDLCLGLDGLFFICVSGVYSHAGAHTQNLLEREENLFSPEFPFFFFSFFYVSLV